MKTIKNGDNLYMNEIIIVVSGLNVILEKD